MLASATVAARSGRAGRRLSSKGIALIIEGFPLWYFDTNCYIVGDEPGGKAIVIDAPGEPEAIAARLAAHSLTPVAILHTHGHIDHIGGSGPLSRLEGGLPAYIHDEDRYRILDPKSGLGGLAAMIQELDLDPPDDIRGVRDGDVIDIAGFPIEAIFTPGHTEGHVCYQVRAAELKGEKIDVLFSGDHLFAGSVGRTDLPGGDWETLMRSMREKILDLSDETLVAPGHGETTTIGRERVTNPFVLEAAAS